MKKNTLNPIQKITLKMLLSVPCCDIKRFFLCFYEVTHSGINFQVDISWIRKWYLADFFLLMILNLIQSINLYKLYFNLHWNVQQFCMAKTEARNFNRKLGLLFKADASRLSCIFVHNSLDIHDGNKMHNSLDIKRKQLKNNNRWKIKTDEVVSG